MNLQRCPQGHFYDADAYPRCPHCDGSLASAGTTVSYDPNAKIQDIDDPNTKTVNIDQVNELKVDDSEKTIGYYSDSGINPVVGWLVCTAGKNRGKEYRLVVGSNFIGRNKENNVALTGETSVSRSKHAVVVYEPKQNVFIALPGEAAELSYVNDEVVLNAKPLKKNDRIKVGNVELMLIPCCDESFSWPQGNE